MEFIDLPLEICLDRVNGFDERRQISSFNYTGFIKENCQYFQWTRFLRLTYIDLVSVNSIEIFVCPLICPREPLSLQLLFAKDREYLKND